MRHLLLAALLCAAAIAPGAAQNAAPGRELESTLTFETDTHRHGAVRLGRRPAVNHLRRWRDGALRPMGGAARTRSGRRRATVFDADPVDPDGLRRDDDRVARIPAQRERQRIHGTVDASGRRRTEPRVRHDAAAPNQGHERLDGVLDHVPTPPRRADSSTSVCCSAEPARSGPTTCGCWSMASRCGTPRKWSGRRRRSSSDHQFDAGSGISISQLSSTQIENLATLGKVWGFLKYHHPAVTSGHAPLGLRAVPRAARTCSRRAIARPVTR